MKEDILNFHVQSVNNMDKNIIKILTHPRNEKLLTRLLYKVQSEINEMDKDNG